MTTALVARLAHGLDDAFPDLVDTHGPMVLTMASRLTDEATGHDITQEVFLRAYRALSGYSDDRINALKIRPWLATITRNLVRNEYRRRSRRSTVPLREDDGAVADTVDHRMEVFDSNDRLAALLANLSEPQREAVVLRHIVGFPMREVAMTMACPEGTAKSHVSRGLSRLREQLTTATTYIDGGTS